MNRLLIFLDKIFLLGFGITFLAISALILGRYGLTNLVPPDDEYTRIEKELAPLLTPKITPVVGRNYAVGNSLQQTETDLPTTQSVTPVVTQRQLPPGKELVHGGVASLAPYTVEISAGWGLVDENNDDAKYDKLTLGKPNASFQLVIIQSTDTITTSTPFGQISVLGGVIDKTSKSEMDEIIASIKKAN